MGLLYTIRRLAILRTVVALQLFAAALQAVFAGQFLAGEDHSVLIHERTGWVIAAIGIIQVLVAAVKKVPRDRVLPFVMSSVLILIAEFLQVGTGYGRFLDVHVPLGALILAGLAAQLVWVCC